jgi:hypothetical protein
MVFYFRIGGVEIVFVNSSPQPFILDENPQQSFDLIMHAVDAKTKSDFTYSFGKGRTTVSGPGEYTLWIPQKQEFEIGPNSQLSFTSDLDERLYLNPAKYECYLEYHHDKSNKVVISVTLTPGAVSNAPHPFLLRIFLHMSFLTIGYSVFLPF